MKEQNIIAIYNQDKAIALAEFDSFMSKTTTYMNELSKAENKYRDCEGKALEKAVVEAMQTCCNGTPFTKDSIKLISGQCFPDIIAGGHFGVEVKTTKSNKWTSTGSSIVESTRQDGVDHIYMLFGKFGGERVEFRCKPYQECLSDIAVTHSPRYLIDMDLKAGSTIFDKMHTDYDTFRNSPNPIDTARKYYSDLAKREGKTEMPWWLSHDTTVSATLKLWIAGTFSIEEQLRLRALMLLLFPHDVCQSNYKQAALWLCTRIGVLKPNMRDLFTAGGKVYIAGNLHPRIVKWIVDLAPTIKTIVQSDEWRLDIEAYNPELLGGDNPYEIWIKQVSHYITPEIIAMIK